MNLLLVDDDMAAVDGLLSMIDGNKLGLEHIFFAYSIRQAQGILLSNEVEILLCDIEMPNGNGLDLLEWLQDRGRDAVSLLLTSHANFQYAQRAVKLGTLDYLLKPISEEELERALIKAVQRAREKISLTATGEYARYWNDNQTRLMEQFFREVLTATIPANQEEILRQAKKRHVRLPRDFGYLPVLIAAKGLTDEMAAWSRGDLEYALKNITGELLFPDGTEPIVVSLEPIKFMAVLPDDQGKIGDRQRLIAPCRNLIEACNRHLHCNLSCYVGELVQPDGLHRQTEVLLEMERENVAYDNRVFLTGKERRERSPEVSLPMDTLALQLSQGNAELVYRQITEYLDELVRKNALDGKVLEQVHHDFVQMVFSVLTQKGIQAHLLFQGEDSRRLSDKAILSVRAFTEWVRYMLEKASEYARVVEQSESMVEKARKYLENNLDQNLDRDDIAGYVCLNPDYLSRLFKKETGMSISEYVINARLKKAKELLQKTDISVSGIASMLGYANFSYFSTSFKKATGDTPVSYRKKVQTKYQED